MASTPHAAGSATVLARFASALAGDAPPAEDQLLNVCTRARHHQRTPPALQLRQPATQRLGVTLSSHYHPLPRCLVPCARKRSRPCRRINAWSLRKTWATASVS